MDIDVIDREELKAKLDRGNDFKLVMVLGDWAFSAKHIPGSLNISTIEEGEKELDPDDEIVVYCSNDACVASIAAYKILKDKGVKNVRRYSGGLMDWESAGYPLEGEMVEES
jgi:rhodanese-related sulfurtransferase